MNYKDHPDIEIPQFLARWEDNSYRNDACAQSILYLDGTEVQPDEALKTWGVFGVGSRVDPIRCLRAWIDYERPESRDIDGHPRFVIEFCTNIDEMGYSGATMPPEIYSGDSETEAEAAVLGFLRSYPIAGRLQKAIRDAEGAFWLAVSRVFPEARTGDLNPFIQNPCEGVMANAVDVWVKANVVDAKIMVSRP